MSEELVTTVCPACGVFFGIHKEHQEVLRRTGRLFYCPNGHTCHWPKPDPEIETLRAKVASLEKKLADVTGELAKEKKRSADLSLELEIWKPASAMDTRKAGVA